MIDADSVQEESTTQSPAANTQDTQAIAPAPAEGADNSQNKPEAHVEATDKPAAGTDDKSAPAADAAKPGAETRFEMVTRLFGLSKKKDAANVADKQETKVSPAGDTGTAAPSTGAANAGDGKAAEGGKPSDAAAVVPKEIAEHPAYKKMQSELHVATDYAVRFQHVQNFMQQNNIEPQEMTQAMSLTALAKTDPEAFYEKLTAMTEEFGITLGKKLPKDLQDEIDSGMITEARARELSQARVEKSIAERRAEGAHNTLQRRDAIAQEQSYEQLAGRWFEETAKRDPDLALKIDAITGEFLRLSTTARPRTQAETIKLMDEAHKNVNKYMGHGKPRTPHTPSPANSTAPAASSATKKPATPQEERLGMIQNLLQNRA